MRRGLLGVIRSSRFVMYESYIYYARVLLVVYIYIYVTLVPLARVCVCVCIDVCECLLLKIVLSEARIGYLLLLFISGCGSSWG